MGKKYVGQTALTIRLITGVDVTGATALIKGKKPSGGTTLSWTATIVDATLGVIQYVLPSALIDESGTWTFWADITFASGKWAQGEPFTEYIYPKTT